MFDTSKYKRTDFHGTIIAKMNQKVLGKMKDELGGQIMTEFVGIGPKNYSYAFLTSKGKKMRNLFAKALARVLLQSFLSTLMSLWADERMLK